MAKDNKWYNLDNAANLYPAISNDRNTNVFRLSCTLNENLDPRILSSALTEAMKSFSYFRMIMRRGLFWYYLEDTDLEPKISIESERPCKRIFYKSEKELLFQVTYFGSRINLEVFHSVGDGGGAIELLRTIVYHYLQMAHPDDFTNSIKFKTASTPPDQAEDSFDKHYIPGLKIPKGTDRSFTFSGTNLPSNSVKIVTAHVDTKQLLTLAKENEVTLTAYLTALMLCAIYEEQMPRRHRNKEIGITIPVDLRGFFSSKTTRNFFGIVDIRYNFESSPVDFKHVLDSVVTQLKEKVTLEHMTNSISFNMNLQQNVFARAVPLFFKNIVIQTAYRINEGTTATTISNMGRITMPEEFRPYIKSFSCLLNPTPIHKVKLTIISYENKMELSFTSVIAETSIERYIIKHLSANGIDVCLTTNGSDM